jgi:hypothetical protein
MAYCATVPDIADPTARGRYQRDLVLVRPDLYVAHAELAPD